MNMEDDVPRALKEDRLAQVIALQRRIHEKDIQRYLGTEEEILIDGAHPKERHTMSGRTDGFRPVSVVSDELEIGDFARVRITDAKGHWLYAERIDNEESAAVTTTASGAEQ
jgi:tRNA-2-methylthio-N6-dimethylallyladenosine synthase